MLRGEVRWHFFSPPNKRRPVLIVTRSPAIALLDSVVIVMITTRIRDIPSEVYLTPQEDGMLRECVVNCDNIFTVRKRELGKQITALSAERMNDVDDALAYALGMNRFL